MRETCQCLPVREAQERPLDLGALEANQQVVAQPLDPGDLEFHARLPASKVAGSIRRSTKKTLSMARNGSAPTPMKTGVQPYLSTTTPVYNTASRAAPLSPNPAMPLTRPASCCGKTSPTVPM